MSHNDVAQAIAKAFELGTEGLELLLRPPKSQEDIDHDLAVALSLAGDVDQTTSRGQVMKGCVGGRGRRNFLASTRPGSAAAAARRGAR